jgi:hypothetical protein
MKNTTKQKMEASRPNVSVEQAIKFCLDQLSRDKKHEMGDYVCNELTYEEVIGALLLARDQVNLVLRLERQVEEVEEELEELVYALPEDLFQKLSKRDR